MDIAFKIDQTEFALAEIRNTLSSALRSEAEQAHMRRDHYAAICHAFEQEHKLSSTEFLDRFEAGTLGDELFAFDWFAAKRGLDIWDRRYRILSEVSL